MSARLTVHCGDCHQIYRMVAPDHSVIAAPPAYCAYCGLHNVTVSQNSDRDTWEVYAEALGEGMTVDLVKQLYAMWIQDNMGEVRFFSYINKLMVQAVANNAAG